MKDKNMEIEMTIRALKDAKFKSLVDGVELTKNTTIKRLAAKLNSLVNN